VSTLRLWTQVVGKIRLAMSPMINHWWQVPLYMTSRGLTTSTIAAGGRVFEIDFDLIDHRLTMEVSDGSRRSFELVGQSVAGFYERVMNDLRSMDIDARIWTMPVEGAGDRRFEDDAVAEGYDSEAGRRLLQVLQQSHRVMTDFRAGFIGKVSPVHLFWGALDLAVTRFSGRPAPPHPTIPGIPDSITRPAYSHEVSSVGFWPGARGAEAFYYSYAYPAPDGYERFRIAPPEAYFHPDFKEFVLPYDVVRRSTDPDSMLLSFFQSTYEAAADLGHWDRGALEDRSALEWKAE
jgi:hypothetical protein